MRDRRNPPGTDSCILDKDPATIDVVNVTRACSNVLVAVAERWNTQRHCHEVFDRLSDAVLADAIKLQTAQQLSPAGSPSANLSSPISAGLTSIPSQRPHSQSVPPNRHAAYWNGHHQQQPQQPQASTYTGPVDSAPLAVDNEFLHCYDDLQHLYHQQQLEDPVMHLSQDWLGYLGGPQGQFITDAQHQYLPPPQINPQPQIHPQLGGQMSMQ